MFGSFYRVIKPLGLMLVLLGGASCTKTEDAPAVDQSEDSSRITFSSTNTGESVELDIDASTTALRVLGPDADIDGKSLGFAYNGPKKISLELDEKKTEYKGLVILRTVGQRQPNGHAPYIYSLMTWKRNGKKSLTIRGASINLPSHIPFERYEWEAMLYLVPDDFELNMTPAGRIPASNLILSYQPQRAGGAQGLINTTQQRTFSLEVPYASSWLPLAKRKNAKGESKLVNPRFQLRPLGAMVAYTVHNSRKKAISLSGIKVVSNVLLPKAKIDLNPGLLDELGPNDLPSWFGYNSDYEDHTYSYDFPVSNLASGSTTTEAVVVWYPTSRAVSRKSFGYNDGTPATSPSYTVNHPEASVSLDPEAASRYAMTHVYAVGANEAGQPITKPNMSLVPIMGSDLNLAGGKAYHMDCELYEQPNIQLGYMSRRPLTYEAANSKQKTRASFYFLTDLKEQNNDNVSLISLDDLGSYVNRSNPQRPRQTAPIKVEGTDYYIPDHNTMALSGLTRANGVFYTNWAYSRTTPPAVTDRRTIFPSRGFTPIEGGKLQNVRRERTITYSDGDKHVAPSLLFRHDTLAAVAGHPVRSYHQSVYRFKPVYYTGKGSDSRDPYMCYIETTAVYLGKYFVGDIKQFIPQSFWDNQQNTANKVVRWFFVPGNRERCNPQPSQVGVRAAYWSLDPINFTRNEQGRYTTAPCIGRYGLYGHVDNSEEQRQATWCCRVLHPYSLTYQGDKH